VAGRVVDDDIAEPAAVTENYREGVRLHLRMASRIQRMGDEVGRRGVAMRDDS
jgi:hypothetical protein